MASSRWEESSARPRARLPDNQGQLNIDYLAGIGIFLLTILFIFQSTYNLFIPYTTPSDEVGPMAEKTADAILKHLSEKKTTGGINVVKETNLTKFLGELGSGTGTEYQRWREKLGLVGDVYSYNFNVRIGTEEKGLPTPQVGNVGRSERVILLRNTDNSGTDGEIAVLTVRVWP